MKKISVVISVYNRSDLLYKCLTSINNQTLIPYEVVLSDDGSQEDITAFITKHKDEFSFPIVYCEQDDAGFRLARCKNNGIKEASGDILVFLDQDIVTTKTYIETISQNIRESRFIVSLPARTTEEQAILIDTECIVDSSYLSVITPAQIKHIRKQYWKEKLYYHLNLLRLRKTGIKLRGGVFSIYKKDLVSVNGFDENFVRWGNEDDDLGRRLNNHGIVGMNPFKKDFTVHLYHKQNNDGNSRENKDYFKKLKAKYKMGYYFCEFGINNSKDTDPIRVKRFN